MSKGFTFIASGDRLSYDVKVTLGEDASLEEVLNAFEHFLRASGFYISMDDYISIEEGLETSLQKNLLMMINLVHY